MGLDWIDYAIIAVYLVGVAWIGTRIGGRQQSSRDYFLGGRALPWWADHWRKNGRSSMQMNHQWTRMNTNRHEDRWTSLDDKQHQNPSAILCPWCDDVMG